MRVDSARGAGGQPRIDASIRFESTRVSGSSRLSDDDDGRTDGRAGVVGPSQRRDTEGRRFGDSVSSAYVRSTKCTRRAGDATERSERVKVRAAVNAMPRLGGGGELTAGTAVLWNKGTLPWAGQLGLRNAEEANGQKNAPQSLISQPARVCQMQQLRRASQRARVAGQGRPRGETASGLVSGGR